MAYPRRVHWLQPVKETNEIGEVIKCYRQNGMLWCSIEETAGRQEEAGEATATGADATIRVRNYPSVSTEDRFQDSYDNVWLINNIYNGDGEIVCDCHRYDHLTEFYICEED